MKNNCITIGIIGASEDKPVLNSINGVLSQSYESIELIITMVGDSQRIFNNINRAVVNFRRDNVIDIKYKFFPKDTPLVEHFEYVRENATGQYICFMRMEDAIYDAESVRSCINVIEQNNDYNAYMFSTLVFEDDSFKEMSISCGAGEIPQEDDVSFIFKNNKRFLFYEYDHQTYEDIVWNMWIHSLNFASDTLLCRKVKNQSDEKCVVVDEKLMVYPDEYKNKNIFEN